MRAHPLRAAITYISLVSIRGPTIEGWPLLLGENVLVEDGSVGEVFRPGRAAFGDFDEVGRKLLEVDGRADQAVPLTREDFCHGDFPLLELRGFPERKTRSTASAAPGRTGRYSWAASDERTRATQVGDARAGCGEKHGGT